MVIDFGMNDFWRLTPAEFGEQIIKIMASVSAKNPAAEFLLIANLRFDPAYVLDSDKNKLFYQTNLAGYAPVLLAMRRPGVAVLDMTVMSEAIYARKTARDCLSNPLHPNDYMARWYARA